METLNLNSNSTTTELILSQRLVYNFKANSTDSPGDFNEAANYQHTLKWLGDETCTANCVCGVLAGNPNGDYGLTIAVGEDQNNVLYSHQSFNPTLEPGDSFVLDLWHTASPSMDLCCFFYCTDDGAIPQHNPETGISQSELESLVHEIAKLKNVKCPTNCGNFFFQINNTQILREISLSKIPSRRSLSSFNIYEFSFRRSPCTEDRCQITSVLQYVASDSCDYTFVCSVLDGNICGSYGVEIDHSVEEEQDVCNQGEIFNGTLLSGQTLAVSLWYTQHMTAKDPNCYLWCRDPKERNKTDTFIDEDTLRDLVSL